ncbi:MAG: IS110 family transposase [Candidatus Eiseniibacteriota bacterium]
MAKNSKRWQGTTIGVDVGDRSSRLCVLDPDGEILEESKIPSTIEAFEARFLNREPARVVLETGTHANWMHDALEAMGHEVIVADSRELRTISESDRKDDRTDATKLARMGRSELKLLRIVDPRSREIRKDLEFLRARGQLVVMRTMLVNHIRGVVKSFGSRMPECSAESLHKHPLPPELEPGLETMRAMLKSTSAAIKDYDKKIEELAETKYPQTSVLAQVRGVAALTALCFVLTIGDPRRFKKTRNVGSFLGATPRRRQSGDSNPKLRITKRGDSMMRTLLVLSAQHLLRRSSPDCDLKRFGTRIFKRGGPHAKQRAVIATARKLSVLLLSMWKTGEVYDPLRSSPKAKAQPQS